MRSLLLLAMALNRKNGDLEATLHYAQVLMAARPDRREASARAAQALIALRRMDEAEGLVHTTVARYPDWTRMQILASDLERLKGSREASLGHGSALIALQPDRPEGYCRATQDLLTLGRNEEAQRVITEARNRLPDDPLVMHVALDVARTRGDAVAAQTLTHLAETGSTSDWTLMRVAQQALNLLDANDATGLLIDAYSRLLHRNSLQNADTSRSIPIDLWEHRRRFDEGIHILTRFSIFDPAFGGFQAQRNAGTSDAYADSLFSDDRMSFKFDVFEHVTVPSLLRQDDRDFTWHIMASDRLSQAHCERLLHLTESQDGIEVQFVSSMAPLFSMEFGDRAISVRLDDDDHLESGFIRRLRSAGQRPGTLLSFPWGRKYQWIENSMRISDHAFYVPNNAQGLAAFGMNVFGCGRHTSVHEAFEVSYDYSPDMFYVCCSEFCDTNRWFAQEIESAE